MPLKILVGSFIVAIGLTSFAPAIRADEQTPSPFEQVSPRGVTFLKGQLHAHTSNSGDSDTTPGDVATWYEQAGYDFVVLTDHNVITTLSDRDDILVLAGVEITQNLETCVPPPPTGLPCILHVNALVLETEQSKAALPIFLPAPTSIDRLYLFRRALEMGQQLGGLLQLNHPNFYYAVDADLIAKLAESGLLLLEIANQALGSNNAGDEQHPSTEELWDSVLSRGHKLWGVATDDAHHYFDADSKRQRGELVYTGDRGFVMVSSEPTRDGITNALKNGEFYASSGLLLSDFFVRDRTLYVFVDDSSTTGTIQIEFVGKDGAVLERVNANRAHLELEKVPSGSYVRVVIGDDAGKKAWIQPVWP